MQTIEVAVNSAVENLLQRFKSSEESAPKRDSISKELLQIIQKKIDKILYDEMDRKFVFKILDTVLEDSENDSRFDSYLKYFVLTRLDRFLEVAKNCDHSANSTLWKIIAMLGMLHAHI